MKKIPINLLLLSLLIISLLANLVLSYLFFYKQANFLKSIESELNEAKSQLTTINCKNVYSQSEGKVVCLTDEELKSQALTDCSKNFRENLDEKVFNSIKSVDELEKLQGLIVKMCMQEKGYE